MLSIGRFWVKLYPLIMTVLALTMALIVRYSHGGPIFEVYSWLTRPFQGEDAQVIEQRFTDARIIELEGRLGELTQENKNLKKLLDYADIQDRDTIAAPIVGRGADHWWRQITLGRGRADGIHQGDSVLGVGGLVGRVTQVTPHSSKVLLISDPSHKVGVMLVHNRVLGVLEGQGSQVATMKFLERVPDVKPGDLVVTSSLSRLYPSGLPVGQVKTILQNRGPTPEATIELTAPFDYLEWVAVAPFEPADDFVQRDRPSPENP